jgi:hypothetical protein
MKSESPSLETLPLSAFSTADPVGRVSFRHGGDHTSLKCEVIQGERFTLMPERLREPPIPTLKLEHPRAGIFLARGTWKAIHV